MQGKYAKVTGFFQFLLASMQGNAQRIYQHRKYLPISIVMLFLWVFLSASGMQKVFYRIGQLQKITEAWGTTTEAFEELKQSPEFSLDHLEKVDKKQKFSPGVQITIANVGTILVVVVFLIIMAQYGGSKAKWDDSIVLTGLCSVPLTVGMLLASGLFKMADGSSGSYLPASLYLGGILALLAAGMTSFIILHVDALAILGLNAWKRYCATLLTVFLAMGAFGGFSKWAMQQVQ